MQEYVVRKWMLRGRSCFVCGNITRVSLWLLCNVHFVQSMQRTHLQTSHLCVVQTIYWNWMSVQAESTHVDACVARTWISCRCVPCHPRCAHRTSILTYLLTPRCRVLPEQLTGLQPVKKFPAFHGTRRFITALTSFYRYIKKTFSVFLWMWAVPLRLVLWFSCYKCL